MQYQVFILLLILLLKSQSTKESGYNCSDFLYAYGQPLEECPPAKFMLEDQLVECYDKYFRDTNVNSKDGSNKYWCWSRTDVSEDKIKNATLLTAVVNDHELTELIKKPFSVRYLFNGSHYKCDFSEEWADKWFSATDYNISPCVTNTSLAVNLKFKPASDNNL